MTGPIIDQRESDWQPGDAAVCIDDDWLLGPDTGPRVGEVLTVETAVSGPERVDGELMLVTALRFRGRAGRFASWALRKLRPNEAKAREEWQRLLDAPAPRPVIDPARHQRERV